MDICFSSHTVQILSQTVQQEPTIGEFFDKSDLVLVRSSNCYLFENRWKLENDEIDSSTVRYWKDEESLLTKLNWTCLKRVKVYQLPRHEMTFFLSNLSKLSSVQHLEIDKLDLYRNSVSNYPFSSLKLLSIDAVRVVDIAGHEVAYEWAKLEITADQLNTVYLGKCRNIQIKQFKSPVILLYAVHLNRYQRCPPRDRQLAKHHHSVSEPGPRPNFGDPKFEQMHISKSAGFHVQSG